MASVDSGPASLHWRSVAFALGILLLSAPAPAEDHLIVGVGASLSDQDKPFALLQSLGVSSVRLDAPWRVVELSPGRYEIPGWLEKNVNEARSRDIEPFLILAYGNQLYDQDKPRSAATRLAFTRYAAYLVNHFRGRVRYYSIWNEWNAATGHTTPGSPDDYIALSKVVYPSLKGVDNSAVILSTSISDIVSNPKWIERFLALGGLRYADGLALNPYNFFLGRKGTPELALERVDRIYALALTHSQGKSVPIYITEMGYPTYSGQGGRSQDAAADDMARFLLLASTRSHVKAVWWYGFRDQGLDPANKEHHFGIYDYQFAPKPAAHALRDVTRLLKATGRLGLVAQHAKGPKVLAGRCGGRPVEIRLDTYPLELPQPEVCPGKP